MASPVIGAHCSIVEGFLGAAKCALAIGADCLQMFSRNPHQWGGSKGDAGDLAAFRKFADAHNIAPRYFHASYLLNLADAERIGKASVTALVHELTLAPELGVRGSVVHVGSWKGGAPDYERLAGAIRGILKKTPAETVLIMENSGTRKIGLVLEEIGELVRRVRDKRFRVCLDTCHLFVAGYDIRTEEKLEVFLKTFDRVVGMERLELWHVNDSRDPLGSYRDRHENIGEGAIGLEPFQTLLNHPKLKEFPFVLEVPGFEGEGPDKRNVEVLKRLVR
jgi:deoxyribonuclease-4